LKSSSKYDRYIYLALTLALVSSCDRVASHGPIRNKYTAEIAHICSVPKRSVFMDTLMTRSLGRPIVSSNNLTAPIGSKARVCLSRQANARGMELIIF
jgi:hypothetical protein